MIVNKSKFQHVKGIPDGISHWQKFQAQPLNFLHLLGVIQEKWCTNLIWVSAQNITIILRIEEEAQCNSTIYLPADLLFFYVPFLWEKWGGLVRKTDSIKTGHCNALQSFSMHFRVRCLTCLTTLLWTKQNYEVFLNLNAVNKWVLHIYQSFLHPSQYIYWNPWSQRVTIAEHQKKKDNTMKK